MEEKELFNYGDKELNVSSLLKYIDSNQQSYLDFYSNSISDTNAFIEKVNYIKEGIKNGNITTDGAGRYTDAAGKILEDDELMSNALHYVDVIAAELSKKPRALTQSEIAQKEEAKRAAAEKSSNSDGALQETKLNFDPENPFIFERSLKSQFGPTLTIPYATLKKTITRGADGKEDYSIVKEQFKNAFNSMRKHLNKYNNSENYISQVNNLESALFDGVWDHKDELAIHQAGLNNDFNSLKDLFTYKLPEYNPRQNYKQQIDQVLNPGDYTVIDGDKKSILYLDEQGKQVTEDITDDEYYKLSGTTAPVTPTDNMEDQSLEEVDQLFEEDHLGWEVLGPLALDIYSIVSPEPYSATGAGLTSDIIGIVQDIRNKGEFHGIQHAANIGTTIAGIVPYIGDAGNVTKLGKKIVNLSEGIGKVLTSTLNGIRKIPKSVYTAAGVAGTSAAYLDLTSEDSLILEQGQKALDAIKNGNITAETVIAVGNGLAVALQVRKGWKKFRSLDPNYVKPKSTKSKKSKTNTKEENVPAKPVEPNYRDQLTQHIRRKNPKIKESDLSAIQTALDKLANQGIWTKARNFRKGQNPDYLQAQKLLREKGKLSEAEIENALKNIMKHAKGGIIKAATGVQVPWRLNFEGTTHKMDQVYNLFTSNLQSYDAKRIAEALNKLNSDTYQQLNFENADNTLGFKNWNTVFNESGLNNLFGYNENQSDYLGVTTRSRKDFSEYLKNQGVIHTGNGDLSWDSESNQWKYSGWEDKSALSNVSDTEDNEEATTSGTKKTPKVAELALKQLKFKKQSDFNSSGTLNSLAGYLVNEIANAEKQKIQKTIPIYQETPTPEKSFKTAYTYDLEKAKNEIMADANSIKPVTSDVSQYYAARNEAIKNAREYTTKLDTAINDVILKTKDENATIAFDNASERTKNANTNARYRHEWEIEQKQGEVDRIDASNQSFQNLNKEIKQDLVSSYRQKKKQRDAYAQKHLLKGIMTAPSNYIDGWTKAHDLIWYKGQNNQLETDEERTIFQQLYSVVQQAIQSIMASYEGIDYEGIGKLHVPEGLMADFTPKVPTGARGMKISKQRMCNFINKLK